MQTNLAKFLNNIFKYVVFFCISFIWLNFYYHNFLACVCVSIIISSIICFILSKIFYNKQEKTKINLKKQNDAKLALTQLMFYDDEELLNYFFNVLSFSNSLVTRSNFGIIVNNTLIVPKFSPELTVKEFLNIYKKFKSTEQKKLVILTNKISNELTGFLNNFENLNLEILCGEQVYFKIIEPCKIMPKTIIKFKTNTKLKLNQIWEVAFNKKNAKGYFLSGLFVMFASLFYRFSLYYQIFGSLLFCFSLFSFYNKKFNNLSTKTLFEWN